MPIYDETMTRALQRFNAGGFHAVALGAGLLVVGIIGLAGWRVYGSQNSTAGNAVQVASQAKPTVLVPAGWQLYADDKIGVQFAYPTVFGSFRPAAGYPQYDTVLFSDVAETAYLPGLVDRFSLVSHKKGDMEVISSKYGPTLKLTGDEWVVTKVNKDSSKGSPKDSMGSYLVGDTYSEFKLTNTSGLNVYSGVASTGGIVAYTLYFVTNGQLRELQLPLFSTGLAGSETVVNDRGLYDDFYQQVLTTVTPY